jgi:hypothetical protein
MFFGLSGSIAGGIMSTFEIGKSGGTNSVIVKTAPSNWHMYDRRKDQISGFGADVSI